MDDWRSILKEDPTPWLLEHSDPSVRYFTLTRVLDRPENGRDVEEARGELIRTGAVPMILSKQRSEGCWEDPRRFYTAKYRGTVWTLIVLAELGADGKDERIRKACEFILENSQDRESGGFSMSTSVKLGGGRHSEVIPCLTGNMVFCLIRFGYLGDPRVQFGIEHITRFQRFDDGEGKGPEGWPYDKFKMCYGRHSCHMGVVKALKALSEIPVDQRSKEVKETIDRGVEHMLLHHIHRQSHNLNRTSKPGWMRLGFPLMYQTDILEILGILARLGLRDERMHEAVDKVVSKQNEKGRWRMENNFNGSFQVDIEEIGKQSKWVTLKALEVIKHHYGSH